MWIAEYNTFEAATGSRRPVLTHLFYGDSREEALAVMRAHLQSDGFFRGCTQTGKYGQIQCWSTHRVYQR